MNPTEPFQKIIHRTGSALESGTPVADNVMGRAVDEFRAKRLIDGMTVFGEQIDASGSPPAQGEKGFTSINLAKATHVIRDLKRDAEGNVIATLVMVGPSSRTLRRLVDTGDMKFVPRVLAQVRDDGKGGREAVKCDIITVDLVNSGRIMNQAQHGLTQLHSNLILEYGGENVKRHDPHDGAEGQTFIDVRVNGKYVVVQYSPRHGYGLSYVSPDPLNLENAPDELHQRSDLVFDRIRELVKSDTDEEQANLARLLDVIHVCKKLSSEAEYREGLDILRRVQRMDSGERDTVRVCFEKGPIDDGDVPSKSSRDKLLNDGFVSKVVVKGQEGYNACTYKGGMAYRLILAGA